MKPRFDFFLHRSMELDFGVVKPIHEPQAFGVNEGDILPLSFDKPKDEIRIKVIGFEEADAFAAHISEEEQFPAFEKLGVGFKITLQVIDKALLAWVEGNGLDLDDFSVSALVDIDEGLVQMLQEFENGKVLPDGNLLGHGVLGDLFL